MRDVRREPFPIRAWGGGAGPVVAGTARPYPDGERNASRSARGSPPPNGREAADRRAACFAAPARLPRYIVSDDGILYAYLDTNALLEFRPLRDNDWRAHLGAKAVVLVITPVVVEELQNIKDGSGNKSKRKRDRASEVLKRLKKELFPNLEPTDARARLREGVEVEYDSTPLPQEFLTHHRLDSTRGDAQLVAAVLLGAARKTAVCLVGDDTGAHMLGMTKGLRCIELPDEWRLGDELDPGEVKLRALEKELAVYQSRAPKLSLTFSEDSDVHRAPIYRPRTAEEAEAIIEFYREQFPVWEERSAIQRLADTSFAAAGARYSSVHTNRYNGEVTRFREQLRACLPTLLSHHEVVDRYVLVDLHLRNKGSAPAEHVEVIVQAPAAATLASRVPSGPEVPKQPRKPKPIFGLDGLMATIRAAERSEAIGAAFFQKSASNPPEWKVETASARFSLRKLKHTYSERLPPLYFIVPPNPDARSFGFEYAIHSDNVVAVTTGRLNVVLDKKRGPRTFRLSLESEPDGGD